MQRRDWLPLFGYGVLAAALLVSLWLISLAPLRSQWGRELTGAAVAIVAMAVGVGLARRPPAGAPRAAPDTAAPPSPVFEFPPAPGPYPASTIPAATAAVPLSQREREVLQLLARGLSNKEMARTLSVSENTVKTHLANLYEKLGARRRTEAVAAARRLGLDLPA
jgi:DNA-binding CsgD family transcriptional regulator